MSTQFYKASDIKEILGLGSLSAAYDIMRRMPHFQEKTKSGLRVKIADFEAYISANTKQPGEFVPRTTPLISKKKQQEISLKEWHKQRREAARSRI